MLTLQLGEDFSPDLDPSLLCGPEGCFYCQAQWLRENKEKEAVKEKELGGKGAGMQGKGEGMNELRCSMNDEE